MNRTSDTTLRQSKWPVKLTSALVIITVLGFIPWDSVFLVELKSDSLQRVIVGFMGLGGLFFLLCVIMVCIMRFNRWYSGLAMLLIPVALMFIGFLLLLNFIAPPAYWKDEATYRSGNDFLVIQAIEYSDDLIDSRIIRTHTPYSKVRIIEELHLISADENGFVGNSVIYKGKTWFKQPCK